MINEYKVREAIKRYGLDTADGRHRSKNIFYDSKRYRIKSERRYD